MTEPETNPEEGAHLTEEDVNRVTDKNEQIPMLDCNEQDCHVATNEFDTSPPRDVES